MEGFRKESDYLGDVEVPTEAYYGGQTERAVNNFPISGLRFPQHFIKSYAMIKKASAIANSKLGDLDVKKAEAIEKSCDEIIEGKFSNQFVVDVFQAGAGTSTNMNLNEVIANRAIEILGHTKGEYEVVHPNDDVNMSQSTNDTFHSTIHIAALEILRDGLLPSLIKMESVLNSLAEKYSNVTKTGRTHLMDAVPISLGQEFSGYAYTIRTSIDFINKSSQLLHQLNLGGTAVGTGVNVPEGFSDMIVDELNKMTGLGLMKAENYFAITQNTICELQLSEALRALAVNLIKISNDIRLMNSGPISGFSDIRIPAVQPGSSIMPYKINPSVPEMLDMVAFQVIGSESTIMLAVQAAQFELNVMMPVIAYNLLSSIEILHKAVQVFTEKTLAGIEPNYGKLTEDSERDPFIATKLVPYIGFEKTAQIVKEALDLKKTIREIVVEKGIMSEHDFNKIIGPQLM